LKRTPGYIVEKKREAENLASAAMNRTKLLKRLEQVGQQLGQEIQQVTRQRLLTDLAAKGVEIEPANMRLGRLETILIIRLQEREKLRVELASLTGSS
jgi:uncharacterized protein (DUF3084 family)